MGALYISLALQAYSQSSQIRLDRRKEEVWVFSSNLGKMGVFEKIIGQSEEVML